MRLKPEHGVAIVAFVALLVVVFWAHWRRTGQGFVETFGNAPVASTYANIYYDRDGGPPIRGAVPPVAPSLFDTRY